MEGLTSLLTVEQIADLAKSGLSRDTIGSLCIRPAGVIELEACGLQIDADSLGGYLPYVIPYFGLDGAPEGHYRLKDLSPDTSAKYRQPAGTQNRIYYPPNFRTLAENSSYIIVTEGEKKAAAACQEGIPAIALGGVDSWRSRTFEIAVSSIKTSYNYDDPDSESKKLILKIASGTAHESVRELESAVAKGLPDFAEFVRVEGKIVLIVFDSDLTEEPYVKPDVQRAAADLAYFFRAEEEIPTDHIRQLILPTSSRSGKMGLDDYLVEYGLEGLNERIASTLAKLPGEAYPRRPNLVTWAKRQLNAGKLSRHAIEKISLSIVAEMDARGRRLVSPDQQFFYFNGESKVVMPAVFVGPNEKFVSNASFNQFLYTEYALRSRDVRVREGLLDAFTAETLLEAVEPHRGLRVRPHTIDYQLGDNHFARVTSSGVRIRDNGYDGTLFLADQTEPLELSQKEIDAYAKKQLGRKSIPEPKWITVLKGLRLETLPGLEMQETLELVACLFYISPWLNRWRGTQLPLEIACAEAASGKSSLYTLRLSIFTGRPELQNVPSDLRDWYAAVASAPGMWVGDNVRFVGKDMRQRISDELARLITEPEPHVTLRKLYTTSERARIAVNTTFAITSIYPPFSSADLQQRSITLKFAAIPEGQRQSNWVGAELEKGGGRKEWVLHHLYVLHRFMLGASKAWNESYMSSHRLANFEQCLIVMAQILGLRAVTPNTLAKLTQATSVADDTTMDGLKEFADTQTKGQLFVASEVVQWAEEHGDYKNDLMLTNSRRLGRYIKAHAYDVAKHTGIEISKKSSNRAMYVVAIT